MNLKKSCIALGLLLISPSAFAIQPFFSKNFGTNEATDILNNWIVDVTKIAFGLDGTLTLVSSSNPLPVTLAGSPTNTSGKASIALARNVYTGTPVTTSTYLEMVTALSDSVTEVDVFDSSGQTLVLAVGAAASEVNQTYIVPGGNGIINLAIATGARVSIKAISNTASTGEIDLTFLK